MPTIDQLKEQELPATPLLLFECVLRSGATERWSTHTVTVGGTDFHARVIDHNLFTLQASSDDGLDGVQKISLTLANADSRFSQLERSAGFKGALVTAQFVFYDLAAGSAVSESRLIFRGIADSPDEITESTLRVSVSNRLSLQRVVLPDVRIERRCPWAFPKDAAQRQEALTGSSKGKYSTLFRCGYSPDQSGGVGNLNGIAPFLTCDYTRTSCEARGMFSADSLNRPTRRFGGLEFVPPQIDVRSFGEKGSHLSPVVDNQARYSDYVPLVYGTAWYRPPVVFARNDGNLTRMEVLLGMGEIESVVKVVVNDVEIPEGQAGVDMTATGWYSLVTPGTRSGAFNLNFTDANSAPLGDPYGSMAMLSVVVPNQISSGQSLAKVDVLLRGLKLEHFDLTGASLGEAFTNNPVWVLLDLLRRSGWSTSELDLTSFSTVATYCDNVISTTDLYGNATAVPQWQCNLVIRNRTSAADLIRGIRNGSNLILTYGTNGLLTLRSEQAIGLQQPTAPAGTNSTQAINGGWPVYEFSDSSAPYSGILRRANGEPTVRLWSRSGGDRPNRLTVEFQDEFNEYQRDSLALVDVDDVLATGREVTAAFSALGVPNFDQASRILSLQLAKNTKGYTYVEFETSLKGIGLRPGDLIAFTYAKEGLQRQLFRIVKLIPTRNYETVRITAQWHDDAWYQSSTSNSVGSRRQTESGVGLPRPLMGSLIDANGQQQFGIVERAIQSAQGVLAVDLEVSFSPPAAPDASAALIPLLSLTPVVHATGGTLLGGQTLYYGLTAVDANGTESPLSFVVAARIPAGTTTAVVDLTGLSFSPSTARFCVYRGLNPAQLMQLAANVTVATTYSDPGHPASLIGPPDRNYDHANFYWRWEKQPESGVDIFSGTTIGKSGLGMAANEFAGNSVRITRSAGAGQERTVTANDATTLTVIPAWAVAPDNSSYFSVAEATWNFGAIGKGSPVHLQVPNQGGASLQISGRSANVNDQESQYELNPLTTWQIGVGGTVVNGPAPLPSYALNAAGQGTVELSQVTFPSLSNTYTINAGTLTLFCWNELNGPPTLSLVNAVSASDTFISVTPASSAQVNDFLQLDQELVQVVTVSNAGATVEVQRAMHQTVAAGHIAGTSIYLLNRSDFVVPFMRGFFGSPASANYTHSFFLPDVRIAAAEFFVDNSWGMSAVKHYAYTSLPDGGIRTLSGGQISIQVEGYLAVETNAAPPFVLEDTHVPRDISAVLREAPTGGPVQLHIRQNQTVYCTLTFAAGATTSNTVDGFGLPPLTSRSQLSLDVVSVPTATGTSPGRSLTVTIRL
jgi:hypothetical protein